METLLIGALALVALGVAVWCGFLVRSVLRAMPADDDPSGQE